MNGSDLSAMDPQARRFLAMVALGARRGMGTSAEDRRRSFEKLMRLAQAPAAAVEARDELVPSLAGGIPIRTYTPDNADRITPGLIYFHGGGLVAGSIDTHDPLCRTLAHEAGCRIVSVGYRLAPEHPFPAAIVDALIAARWIARHAAELGLADGAIAVGGDSGGGTLAAIVCQVLHHRFSFKAQVLLCPVLDFVEAWPSRDTYGEGFLLDRATMARDMVDYAPSRAVADPRISPMRARPLARLPHTIIHAAGFDPLRDEAEAFAVALREVGVPVNYTCHAALIHHFYALTAAIPAAGKALTAIAADIRRALA